MKKSARSVEFVKQVHDYGNAYEFLATGVARMFIISPSIVRIAFVRTHVRDDSEEEERMTGSIDCDVSQLPAMLDLIRQGLATLLEDAPTSARTTTNWPPPSKSAKWQ
jgi:hypothetical protein